MTKKLSVSLLFAAVLVALSCGAALASMPSLLGPTGVVATPNALVAPRGQVQTVVDYERLNTLGVDVYEEEFTEDNTNNLWGFEALAGIFNGAELWAAYNKDNGDFNMKTWGVGAKYQLPLCPKSNINLALGASYRKETGDTDRIAWTFWWEPDWINSDQFDGDLRSWDVYFAATADLSAVDSSCWCGSGKLFGTVGVIYKKLDFDVTDNMEDWFIGEPVTARQLPDWDPDYVASDTWNVVDDHLTRPFVSLEYFAPSRTSLAAEYRWKSDIFDRKPVSSVILRHEFLRGFTAAVGYTNADSLGFGLKDHSWFGQVGYNFGWCK